MTLLVGDDTAPDTSTTLGNIDPTLETFYNMVGVVAEATGTADNCFVYIQDWTLSGSSLVPALYDAAGDLIATYEAITDADGTGWISTAVDGAAPDIINGQTYYLGLIANGYVKPGAYAAPGTYQVRISPSTYPTPAATIDPVNDTNTSQFQFAIYIDGALGAAVEIGNIDSDNTVFPGQTGAVIPGATFEAAQGGGTVELRNTGNTVQVAQTVTAWADTSITVTVVQGGLQYATDHVLYVENDSAGSDSLTGITLVPPGTNGYVNISGLPWPSGQYSVLEDVTAAAVDGDQLEYTNPDGDLTMHADGTFTKDEPGTFEVRIWDQADSTWSDWETITVTEASPGVAPTLDTPIDDQAGTVGVAFSLNVAGNFSGETSFAASGLPAGLSINTSTGAITGSPTTVQTVNATITATNLYGSTNDTVQFTIASAGPVPTLVTPIPDQSGTVGTAFALDVSGNFTGETSYSASSLPTGLSMNTAAGVISGTPSAAGTFNATINAINSNGTRSDTVDFVISLAGPAPTLDAAIADQTATVGILFTLNVAGNFSGETSFSASGLPAGLSINTSTGVISGTPTTAQTVNATITATNANGSTNDTVQFTVSHVSLRLRTTVVTRLDAVRANLSNLKWVVFASWPTTSSPPLAAGTVESTDADGLLEIDVTGVGLMAGQFVWLVLANADDTLSAAALLQVVAA